VAQRLDDTLQWRKAMTDVKRVFTPSELVTLVTAAGDLASQALDSGDIPKARQICIESKDMHRPLHDNYSLWHAKTLSCIAREYGLEALHDALSESVSPFLRPIAESFRNGVTREAVSAIAQIWRMYCLSFGPIEEDDATITITLAGYGEYFTADQSGLPSKELPESAMSLGALHVKGTDEPRVLLFSAAILHGEGLMAKWLGYPPFVVEFHSNGTPRSVVIYKDPSQIPQRFFDRTDAKRDARLIRGAVDVAGGRLFTDAERHELARQHMDRAVSSIDRVDIAAAKGWCQLSKGEWYPAHHIHRDWITGQLAYVYRKFGVDAAYGIVSRGYNAPFMEPMLNSVETMDFRTQVETLAMGFRQHAMRFRIEEDDDKFVFATEPCGSGGRLIQEGSYDFPKNFPRIKENHKAGFYTENFPIYCTHCPATNEFALQRGGPYFLLVDGDLMTAPTGNCNFYIFKNPAAVPDRFFRRAGLERGACAHRHPQEPVPPPLLQAVRQNH
jgi:hypothetical protein